MIGFSIIVPTLNQARFIKKTLESILSQDYSHKEIIVIDGGSSDSTVEILKEYNEITWVSEPDTGAANAINKGMKMANGDVVSWLNSDDFYDTGALKIIAEVFENNPDAELVYGDLTFVDENGSVLWNDYTHGYDLDTLVHKNADCVRQPCTFFKKKLFTRSGGVDESLRCVFDYELFIRMIRLTKPYYINKNLAFYRDYADTLTRKFINRQGREIISVARRNGAVLTDQLILSSYFKKILFPWYFFRKK